MATFDKDATETELELVALRRIRVARRKKAKDLDLEGLGLASIPKAVGQLTHLRTLRLSGNKLADLPVALESLTKLQTLHVSNNQLTYLTERLGRLLHLENLDLSDNQLKSISETIGQLANLQTLVLSRNHLTSIPEAIGQLANLERLDLSRNQMRTVPEALGQLTQLRTIDLSNNKLSSVPRTIGDLSNLTLLDLSNNQLTNVPDELGQLTELEELYLSTNRLTNLSQKLGGLSSLCVLTLHGNEKLGIPSEILGPEPGGSRAPSAPRAILDYFFSIGRDSGVKPLNEAKLILVGWGAVGKTSLVNRLVYGRFDLAETKTEGIAITRWDLKLNHEEDVKLNVWDFGGQEIMHGTHQFFLSKRSLYVLVLSGRQGHEDADAEYWLTLIESFGPDCPVLVVLNKTLEQPFELNRGALQQKYSQIRGFVRTDCKENVGIAELRKNIEEQTDKLSDLRAKFRASWFAIKDSIIPRTGKNFISFPEYRAFCRDNGEKDEGEQDKLADFLHCLGIALNFRDDPRLRGTHVLNPHWITKGIYTIINDKTLETRKGVLHHNLLNEILDRKDFPSEMHGYVLDLMKKFELCFLFHDREGQYLIPTLLPKEEPPEAKRFKPEDCLNFEYHYRIVPDGLLPRFIVRTHVMSNDDGRWRTGVILSFEGSTALVKSNAHDRKVTIRVQGPKEGRRRLLAVIRSDFERIHADIRNLNPREMVPVPEHPDVVISYRKLCVLEAEYVGRFREVSEDKLLDLDVRKLLNGVDLDRVSRKRTSPSERTGSSARLFYSYSHKDEGLRNQLETHLKLLQRQDFIAPWHDRMIGAREEWETRIDENLERADIVLLLVSADFIASDYCYDIEMKRAMERHEAKEAHVIPVILRDVNWTKAPFAKLQALPKDAKPVTSWFNRDEAWRNVADGIEKAVVSLRK